MLPLKSSWKIRISDLLLNISAEDKSYAINIPESFSDFVADTPQRCDIHLSVHAVHEVDEMMVDGDPVSHVPAEAVKLPSVMTPPGPLWEVRRRSKGYRISTWSHDGEKYLPLWIDFDTGHSRVKLHTIPAGNTLNPLGYPACALMVYLVSTMVPSVLIHASALYRHGKGFLFTGLSGAGKSTMASIWSGEGATVIHDDRVMLRPGKDSWHAYSTPVNDFDTDKETPLNAIYVISHGPVNSARKISGMEAYTAVLENCIQHQYDRQIISNLLESVHQLTDAVPVYGLQFKNDTEVVGFVEKMHMDE